MQNIVSFLNRKKKMNIRQVSKNFGPFISYKSMVSLRFLGADVIKKSRLLASCVFHSRKVTKIIIEEVIVDLEYVKALEIALGSQPFGNEKELTVEEGLSNNLSFE